MPRYDYRCPHCEGVTTMRRAIGEMDDPIESLCCGAPMARQFTPTANVLIPLSFRQVLTGGQPGGGQYSWSDFHDVSEKELARNPSIERYSRVMSEPGVSDKPRVRPAFGLGDAFNEARQMPREMREAATAGLPTGAEPW